MNAAGALGTYLWKNRGMQRNADQVFVILGAALLAIAWGAKSDTFVDNVGKHLIETSHVQPQLEYSSDLAVTSTATLLKCSEVAA